jgi:glycosyltransferase involved in cell wall biosynthesis
MLSLSAVIITFNEERHIARCIDSLRNVADEIVVVDSLSTDRTREICMEKGVRFISHVFEGYVAQKNFAVSQATNDHVLSVDADEVLSDSLARSINDVRSNWLSDAYYMNRRTDFCGKWVLHGGWYPDRKIRLFRKQAGSWEGLRLHESYRVKEGMRIGYLNGDLLHYSYGSVSEHLRQIDRFSLIAAEELFEKGVRSNAFKVLFRPLAKFISTYLLKRGFLDGWTGLIIACNSAHGVFLKYLRLLRLQKGLPA